MVSVGTLVFGVVGFVVWYASMFVDNRFAVVMVLGGIAQLAEVMGAPQWLLFCIALLMLCLMVPAVSAFLPIKFPNCFHADWQYAKRHGLLNEKDTIS